jgi:hypothetical protein
LACSAGWWSSRLLPAPMMPMRWLGAAPMGSCRPPDQQSGFSPIGCRVPVHAHRSPVRSGAPSPYPVHQLGHDRRKRDCPCTLKIWCQTAGSAATFTTASKSITSRPGTSHSVDGELPLSASASDWLTGDRGLNQRTPDLRHLVQEVIDGAGWASGHGLVFLLHTVTRGARLAPGIRSRSCDPGAGEADPQVRYPMIRPDFAQLGRPRPSATRPRSGSLARRRLPGRAARLRTGDIRSVMTEGLTALVHRLAPVGTLKS